MTLQQIMYFQRVARSGSFTKAARACFVSQTAISRQISALEEELHVTLLERDTAHVKLTLAGEYFFQQVNELTARLEEVVTRTQTIAQEQQTHLTLGIPTILEQHAISQLLRQYHSLHPEVQLSTVAGSRHQLVSQLVDRKIDLLVAMDFDLPDLEGLDSIILQQVHATWLLPTGHPLAGAEKIAPQQLQGETLILTQEDPRGNTEELLRQYYNQLGLKGNPVLHTRTLEELFLLAALGWASACCPLPCPNTCARTCAACPSTARSGTSASCSSPAGSAAAPACAPCLNWQNIYKYKAKGFPGPPAAWTGESFCRKTQQKSVLRNLRTLGGCGGRI